MPQAPRRIHTVKIFIAEIFIGLFVSILSLWVFFEVSQRVLNRQIDTFDYYGTYVVQMLRSPIMTEIMKGITIFGGPGILAGSLIIALFLSASRHNRRSLSFLILIITGVTLNILLKFMFHRSRPVGPLVDEYFFSFPSGHAMNSTIFYGAIAYMFYHYTRDKILGVVAAISLGIWIFLIGISRIYLGVHYPSDVLAGFLAGFWWLVTVLVFEKIVSVNLLLQKPKRAS